MARVIAVEFLETSLMTCASKDTVTSTNPDRVFRFS